jgi:[pyruvate, water dikinase]-phosphate phosphotransferase / [pyruvate, water dikinase] kinase
MAKAKKAAKGHRVIYLLSDSTGNLARHMVTAFLTQFPGGSFDVRERTFLSTPEKVAAVLEEVGRAPGIVLHALVSAAAKGSVEARCATMGVPARDLTGGFVEFIARESGVRPAEDAKRLHHVDESYLRRIEAIEFAMQHDDGLGLETLHDADVVMVGVSRTSKTPTTIYLAQMGYKAGNYAMAMPIEPPKEVMSLPRGKVVGLYIDPAYLAEIRTVRQREWQMGDTSYNDRAAVRKEVEWSRRLFERMGWKSLDITGRAVEESAARILDVLGLVKNR